MNKTARSHVFSLAGLLFLLSGATSLAYEVVWVKLLTLELVPCHRIGLVL